MDSVIPNLALMRLSAFHKARGDDVRLYAPIEEGLYDKVYASKVFNFSDKGYLRESMDIAGTGWDMLKTLPEEVEQHGPDYSLYQYPHNIGFTMRGCRLKCKFCVVPQKEGGPRSVNTIDQLWTQRSSNFLMLLDNDFFGNPDWRDRIEEIKAFKLRVNFSQGLNIRNLKPEQAEALASVDFRNSRNADKMVMFAWDDPRHEKLIHKGIQICADAGITGRRMGFYVLIGYHSTPEEDLHRVETLRSYGCYPYAMPYDKSDPYQKRFTRWVNHRAIFKTVQWKDYCK